MRRGNCRTPCADVGVAVRPTVSPRRRCRPCRAHTPRRPCRPCGVRWQLRQFRTRARARERERERERASPAQQRPPASCSEPPRRAVGGGGGGVRACEGDGGGAPPPGGGTLPKAPTPQLHISRARAVWLAHFMCATPAAHCPRRHTHSPAISLSLTHTNTCARAVCVESVTNTHLHATSTGSMARHHLVWQKQTIRLMPTHQYARPLAARPHTCHAANSPHCRPRELRPRCGAL